MRIFDGIHFDDGVDGMSAGAIKKAISRCGRAVFWPDISVIEDHDPHALKIQADLDAEHGRHQRSTRKIYYPPGTLAPRRLTENNFGGIA